MPISLLSKIASIISHQRFNEIDFAAIEKQLHYHFHNKQFLLTAFKHSSYLSVSKESADKSNERLEFLGDAVLDLVVSEFLFSTGSEVPEGDLSKMKSILVSGSVLAEVVAKMDLGKHLLINRGEEKTGGRQRASNLANLYESILGAIYLDGGLNKAQGFIQRSLLDGHHELLNHEDFINYKSILLEYAQRYGPNTPTYRVKNESGPDHDKKFVMEVSIDDVVFAEGEGKSKKLSEQAAAHSLIKKILPDLLT